MTAVQILLLLLPFAVLALAFVVLFAVFRHAEARGAQWQRFRLPILIGATVLLVLAVTSDFVGRN